MNLAQKPKQVYWIKRAIACLMLAICMLETRQVAAQNPSIEEQIQALRDSIPPEAFKALQNAPSDTPQLPLSALPGGVMAPNGNQPSSLPDPSDLPPDRPRPPGELQVNAANDLVSIFARDADLRVLLATLAKENRLNIIPSQEVTGLVSVTLHDKPVLQALDAILRVHGYTWQQIDNIIYVSKPDSKLNQNATLLGLQLQVFELNYIAAVDAEKVITGLLSPGGRVFAQTSTNANPRQSGERLIVEDFPDRVQRIAEYIQCVDIPPRQVLIEAEILQVNLNEDERHGVNLEQLLRVGDGRVIVESTGMATVATGAPSFTLGVESTDLTGVIEFLKAKSNVRTLATPKLLVVTGQEGKIQVGSKLGFTTLQQNQTSTVQNVEFLELGVILTVSPIVTRDGQVFMKVQPQVSGGRINSDTKLPEEETTQTETTVILPDGRGMIIGGLIKEDDSRKSSWVPYLGEMPILGGLFRRRSASSARSEVIIALTPHIVPYQEPIFSREANQYRTITGLEPNTGEGQWSRQPMTTPTEFPGYYPPQPPLPQQYQDPQMQFYSPSTSTELPMQPAVIEQNSFQPQATQPSTLPNNWQPDTVVPAPNFGP
jgi:type IV pilus assembly protein PilQ